MKRTLTNIILAFGSAYLCAAGLHAQSFTMKANVPFDFQATGMAHSSGKYIVEHASNSPILTLRNEKSRETKALGMATNTESNSGPARLTFHRYGNTYFLAEVWNPEQTGTKLPMSAREKEIRRAAKGSDVATLSIACVPSVAGL